ncbi:hypothetical protein PEP31012_00379 [Pandoraea eparura]|uniref:Uncharacterized protein n=1 Tax=Pandoraea eparura TaxID=2508291 RepID=A0A5E4RUU7_9BURK|nr:hypothetical protein PEP31012_00379 [Pandoraea eparura]
MRAKATKSTLRHAMPPGARTRLWLGVSVAPAYRNRSPCARPVEQTRAAGTTSSVPSPVTRDNSGKRRSSLSDTPDTPPGKPGWPTRPSGAPARSASSVRLASPQRWRTWWRMACRNSSCQGWIQCGTEYRHIGHIGHIGHVGHVGHGGHGGHTKRVRRIESTLNCRASRPAARYFARWAGFPGMHRSYSYCCRPVR